jgi:hypothetical protein
MNWIPVSEKLPPKSLDRVVVLATIQHHNGETRVIPAAYFYRDHKWHFYYDDQVLLDIYGVWKVTAWMMKPSAYITIN